MKKIKAILVEYKKLLLSLIIIAIVAFFVGLFLTIIPTDNNQENIEKPAVQSAPSVISYRSEARAVVEPFFSQILAINNDEELTVEAQEALRDLTNITQERLLRMRVPSEEKKTHLALVLLLGQWKDYFFDSNHDLQTPIEETYELLGEQSWIYPELIVL